MTVDTVNASLSNDASTISVYIYSGLAAKSQQHFSLAGLQVTSDMRRLAAQFV